MPTQRLLHEPSSSFVHCSQNWKKPACASGRGWGDRFESIHELRRWSVVKEKELPASATMWVNLRIIMLSKRRQTPKNTHRVNICMEVKEGQKSSMVMDGCKRVVSPSQEELARKESEGTLWVIKCSTSCFERWLKGSAQLPKLIKLLRAVHVTVCICVHAKLFQLCPTLCDPMDCSLPGSSVHGDSPGKNTGVGCPALLQGIFLTQVSNSYPLHLLHCRRVLYH